MLTINAIAKLINAVGTALGATGTAVAAFIGALSYREQHKDKLDCIFSYKKNNNTNERRISIQFLNRSSHRTGIKFEGIMFPNIKRFIYINDDDSCNQKIRYIEPNEHIEYTFKVESIRLVAKEQYNINNLEKFYLYFSTFNKKKIKIKFNLKKLEKKTL